MVLGHNIVLKIKVWFLKLKCFLQNLKPAIKVFRLFIQYAELYVADVKALPDKDDIKDAVIDAFNGEEEPVDDIPDDQLVSERNKTHIQIRAKQNRSNLIQTRIDNNKLLAKMQTMTPEQRVDAEAAHARMMTEKRTKGFN